MTLPVFPLAATLPGLGYSVKWSPVFFNQSFKAMNGASIDIGLSPYPLHNFELTFNFLRDAPSYTERQILMGFFAMVNGPLGRFLFYNVDDGTVTATSTGYGQTLQLGDGLTTTFTIGRSLGAGAYIAPPEPVGYVFPVSAVYWNGVLQSSGSYTVTTTALGAQAITFSGAPPSNTVIGITMVFYYYCKFADDTMTFDKFVDMIWSCQSVKIQSCPFGA
jgi:hypothetical protein